MKKTTTILTVLCMSFLIFSCSKKDKTKPKTHDQLEIAISSSNVIEGDKVEFTVTSAGKEVSADIYVNTNKISGSSYTFDKTGEYIVIAKKEGYPNSDGLKITVKEPVVYLAGILYGNSGTAAAYWKNGNWTLLGDMSNNQGAMATGIVAENGDVYVSGLTGFGGSQPPKAVYWKNGTKHELGDGYALGITISDGDVYIAGTATDANGDLYAVYWTLDGQKTVLDNPISMATAIDVDEGTVYTAGITEVAGDDVFAYWKDDNRTLLQYQGGNVSADPVNLLASTFFPPISLALHQGDVYVTFPYNPINLDKAVIWKNGKAETLSAVGVAGAFTLTESKGNLYVGGLGDIGINNPHANFAYWKDGSYNDTNESAVFQQQQDIALIPTSMAVYNGKVYMAGNGSDGVPPPGFLWKAGEKQVFMDLNKQQAHIVNDIFVGRE